MRSVVFNFAFILTTIIAAIGCFMLSLIPGRAALMWGLRLYTRSMMWHMRALAGIKVTVSGHENIPDGPVIIASKHLSYGDGFVLFSQFKDLSFVTGDHITKFLFVKTILAKMNAVIVSSCGGAEVRRRFAETSQLVREQGRRILIFPEGHLSEPGTHHSYKRGVYHLYRDFNCPVVPVAQNLGQRWNMMDLKKYPGPAKMEFLSPIEPGLDKDAFMALLQERIETRSLELLDYENLGALDVSKIGQLIENKAAKAAREAKEAAKKASIHAAKRDNA
jgi:1-acyl-sn-glycerol-3-phosphate acyltransferase